MDATLIADEIVELQERIALKDRQLAKYHKALEEINRRCGEATRASRRDVWPDILYIFDEVKKALR